MMQVSAADLQALRVITALLLHEAGMTSWVYAGARQCKSYAQSALQVA